MNLAGVLDERARAMGEKTAIEFEGQALSFLELFEAVRRRMVFLEDRGIQRGDRVALQLPKSLDFIFLHLAVMARGAVSLPLNDRFTPAEVAYFLEDSGASLYVADEAGLSEKKAMLEGMPGQVTVSVEEVASETVDGSRARFADTGDQDIAMICYTSGTTGKPKGTMITHGNLLQNMEALKKAWRWTDEDVLLHVLPLFHIHGLVVALHGAIHAGSSIFMMKRFDPLRVTEVLRDSRCTLFMGVPTLYRRLVNHWDQAGSAPDLAPMRLFISGSAPLPENLWHRFQAMTGHAILERYGMTETGMIASNPYPPEERKPGSVGYPLEGVRIRIRDEKGAEIPHGQVGEVQVRGPNVFPGYWNAPEKTAASFDAGWFKTGDLGRLDPDDALRLYLAGRSKELIISGGFNVYPREVEEVLLRCEHVEEAAVVGLPDEDLGERVVAAVVPPGGIKPDERKLIAYCLEHLAPYKCPKAIRYLDQLPRNTMGKVQIQAIMDDIR